MEDGTIIGRVLDFEAIATDALLNERRLGSLRELRRGVGRALDFDRYRPGAAVVWVVGRDDDGNDLESLVALVEADGSWSASDWSEADYGWADLAANRPDDRWWEFGPVLLLGIAGHESDGKGHQSGRGIAARSVTEIEFGPKGSTRRRTVDSPTGAFLLAVPHPPRDQSPIIRAHLKDGRSVDLNP